MGFSLCSCSVGVINVSTDIINHGSLIMYQHCQVFEDFMHLADLLLDFFYPLLSFFNNSLIKRNLIVQQYKFLSATTTTKPIIRLNHLSNKNFVCINFTFLIQQEAHAALEAYLHSHLSHWLYSYNLPKPSNNQLHKHKLFWIFLR